MSVYGVTRSTGDSNYEALREECQRLRKEMDVLRAERDELRAEYERVRDGLSKAACEVADLTRQLNDARDKALEDAWRLERGLQEASDQTGLYNLAISDYARAIHRLRESALKGASHDSIA